MSSRQNLQLSEAHSTSTDDAAGPEGDGRTNLIPMTRIGRRKLWTVRSGRRVGEGLCPGVGRTRLKKTIIALYNTKVLITVIEVNDLQVDIIVK